MEQADIGGKPVQLNDGETIIWQGRPAQGVLRNPVHIGTGLALLALGLWLVLGKGTPFFSTNTFLGLALVLTGGYLASLHAHVEANRRASTFYAITNQRAIFAYSLRILACPVSRTSRIELKSGRFDTVIIAADHQIGAPQSTGRQTIGFGHLENGQAVYDLLMSIKEGSNYGT